MIDLSRLNTSLISCIFFGVLMDHKPWNSALCNLKYCDQLKLVVEKQENSREGKRKGRKTRGMSDRVYLRQADRDDARKKVQRCDSSVVVVDVVDINFRVSPHDFGDTSVPC